MSYSIKWRILAAVLLSQFLLGLTLSVATVVYSRNQWLTAFDAMLASRTDSVLAALDDAPDNSKDNLLVFDARSLTLPPGDLFEVRDERGRLVWRSKDWVGPPGSAVSSAAPHFRVATPRGAYRGVVIHKLAIIGQEDARPTAPRLITVTYASSTAEMDARIRRIELFAALASLLLMGLTSLLGAWGVNKGLAPMRDLASEAGRISARNWRFHPPPSAQRTRELAPLVRALQGALAGLERAFSSQRDFIADAAHELRTSVAILKSSLQLLTYQPLSVPEYHAGMARCVDDCGRVEELVRSMLTLARAEQMAEEGERKPVQPVELAGSCEQAVGHLRSLAEAGGVAIQVAAVREVYVPLDERDLQVLWSNLLHNAIQYSPPGSVVCVNVRAASPGALALVQIEDSGNGIPADQLPHVFQRFRRCDPSRSRTTGGFGLGLSICKAIADAYGGGILIENRNGCGTRVSVSLPALARPRNSSDSAGATRVADGKSGMNGSGN